MLRLVSVLLFAAVAAPAPAAWLGEGPARPPVVTVDDADPAALRIVVTVPGVLSEAVVAEGRTWARIALPGGYPVLAAGEPDLPFLPIHLAIPGRGTPAVTVTAAIWREVPTAPVLPSRGNLPRTLAPADQPLTFGPAYAGGVAPPAVAEAGRPYLLRNVRGLGLTIRPVRWDADRGVLRVLERLELTVATAGSGGENVLPDAAAPPATGLDDRDLLARRFANPPPPVDKYRPVATGGRMLVVAPRAFVPLLEPFLQWKRERGIVPLVLAVEDAGGTASAIADSVRARYREPQGLTYLVLAGDEPLVPGFRGVYEGADDDTRYAQVAGDDLYPDLFVSRVSARDTLELRTQLVKFVRYERDPDPGGAWYARAVGAASNLGDPTDAERADDLRARLLDWTFTDVDRLYEPDATGAMITAALDDGRSLLNYLGHGSGTSWSNPPFGIADVHALGNGFRNPWIVDVSCANGRFSDPECFAEAWLRTGTPDNPAGAVAMYSASTTTPWVPPTVMQDEVVDLLTTGAADEIGALCQQGIMKVLDVYPGDEGRQLVEQYNIFGDCSLQVRTAAPQPLTVRHAGQLAAGVDVFAVDAGVAGARVALTSAGVLRGTAVTDATGYAAVPLALPAAAGDAVILTVTGRNLLTHREAVPVTVPVTVALRPTPSPLAAGRAGALAVDLSDPAAGLDAVDVTLSGWGVPTRTVRTTGTGTADFADLAPRFGEDLVIRGRDADGGLDLFRVTVPVTGAVDLTAPRITAGVAAIAMRGALTPDEPGLVTGAAVETGLELRVVGCGIDTLAAAAGDSVAVVVRPDSTGTLTVALLKDGCTVHTAIVPVVAAIGTVGGRVTDAGNGDLALPGARVRMWRAGADRGERPLVDTVSDGQGWWRFEPDLPVGTFDLLVERFGYVARDTAQALLFGANDWRTALQPAPRDLLRGTVTAAGSGAPVGAALEVRRPDDRVLVASLYADGGTGAFASAPLPVGTYLVVATARGYRPVTLDLPVSVGGAAADLVLEPLAGSIVVVDANLPAGTSHDFAPRLDKRGEQTAVGYTALPAGSGLAMVAALADLGYAPAYQPTALVDTAAWSGYDLVVLARGDHDAPLPADLRAALLARARRGGALLLEGGDLAAAHRDDPEFLADVLRSAAWAGDRGDTVDASNSAHPVAQRPAPVFTALDEAGRGYADGDALVPAADAAVCAAWADGRAAAVARSRDPQDAGGRSVCFAFTWNRLAPTERARLLQNAVEWLLAPVAADATLDGRVVLDGDGTPAVGAVVRLEPGGRTAVADAVGAFRFDGLPAGAYRLVAETSGRLGAVREVAVAGGATATPDLLLPAAADTLLCAADSNLVIPDDAAAGVLASITLGDLGPVGGVRVQVAVDHPWPGDLELELIAPGGARTALRRADGRADATVSGWYAGDLRPAGDLHRLIGTGSAGPWTLRVADTAAGDVGVLRSWCLDLLVAPAPPPPEEVPPVRLAVLGAAPNPFNPRTVIRYAVPAAGSVTLTIHDLRGRRVRTLVDGERSAAIHEVVWDGADDAGRAVASGAYLVRLKGAQGTGSGKIMLVR